MGENARFKKGQSACRNACLKKTLACRRRVGTSLSFGRQRVGVFTQARGRNLHLNIRMQ